MSIEAALARRRGEAEPEPQGDIRAKLAARRGRLPRPPEPAENFREVMGQVGDVGAMVGKMAIPAVAGAAAGAALPPLGAGILGTLVTGAIGGTLGGAASTVAGNVLEGGPVTKGITPGTLLRDAALGGGSGVALRAALPVLGAAGRGVARGVRGLVNRLPRRVPPVSALPGYDDATSLRAALPDVEPMPLMMHDQPDMRVAPADLEMGPLDRARTGLSSPEFVLRRTQNTQAGQIAGARIRGMNRDIHRLRATAHAVREQTGVAAMGENERRAVLVARAGRFDELPPQYQTQEVLDAADRAGELFRDADDLLTNSRAATIATTGPQRGQAVPHQSRGPNYIPWIPAADEGPGRTRTIRQLLANRRRPPQTNFERAGTRGPDTQALEELWGIEGPPTQQRWVTDADEAMRVYIDGGRGRAGLPEIVARSRHFGPIQRRNPDAAHPWGEDANVLYQQMLEAEAPLEANLFKSTMESVYRPDIREPYETAATGLKDLVSRTLLGQTATTQLTQAGTPVWRFGMRNDLRGKYDYLTDPSYRRATARSGAQDAAFARELGHPETAGAIGTRVVEENLRGFGNAGARPYLQEMIDQASAGNVNAALRKKAAELGFDIGDLSGGQMTADDLMQALEESAHRNQFHPYDPGGSGALFMTPVGKAATMYQPFGHAAWRNAQEDILEPLFGPQGWREAYNTGDYSLQGLGAARAARLAAAGIPSAVLTEGLKSIGSAREFDPSRVATNFLDSNIGTPSMLASSFASGYRPENNLIPPWLSLLGQEARNLQGGHPERLLIDAAAMGDRSGWAAVARPFLQGLTKEDR